MMYNFLVSIDQEHLSRKILKQSTNYQCVYAQYGIVRRNRDIIEIKSVLANLVTPKYVSSKS